MACHKIAGTGHAVGPDLTSSASHDARALLVHVLDPNRYLLPNYEQYVCVDTSGRVVTGMITAQTATSITLKREENKTETILRGQIEELTSSGKSLMPEGLEKKLTKQDMADLIAWLQSTQTTESTGNQPLHIGTLPGLIEPDD
jgi:putative heme-binding domain-containing protein